MNNEKLDYPLPGQTKMNSDGAAKGNPSPTRCGAILRGKGSTLIKTMAIPLETPTTHVEEVVVLLYQVKLSINVKY